MRAIVDPVELARRAVGVIPTAEGGDPPGLWLGSGASVLGLAPVVTAQEIVGVFHGNAPRGPTLADPTLDRRPPGEMGAQLIDFKPPEAMGALWAIAPDTMRKEIETAQFKAVRSALDYLESSARIRTASGELVPAGLVAAAFQRGITEGNRPGFRTEVALFNVGTFGREGWTPTGLDMARLNEHLAAAQALYRAQLSHQLRTWIGVRPEPAGNTVQIGGFAPSIVKAIHRTVVDGPSPTREQMHEQWRATAERHGLKDVASLRGKEFTRRDHADVTTLCRETMQSLARRQNHFAPHQAVRQLAERCRGGELSAEMVRGYVRDHVVSRAVEQSPDRSLCRSRQQLVQESKLAQTVKSRAAETAHQVPRDLLPRLLRGVDRDMKRVLIDATVKPGGCVYVDRLRPEQREQFLTKAHKAWRQAGLIVSVVGPDKKSFVALSRACGIARRESLSKVLGKYDQRWSRRRRVRHGLIGRMFDAVRRPFVGKSTGKEPFKLWTFDGFSANPKSVIVVNDAAKLGPWESGQLMELARVTGAKLVFLGDDRQMAPDPVRSPIQGFMAGNGVLSVGGPRPELNPLAADLRMAEMAKSEKMTVAEDRRQLVADWAANKDRAGSLMVTATRNDCATLNRLAQAQRKSLGELGEHSIRHGGGQIFEGDRIVIQKRIDALGLKAGTTATVERVVAGQRGGDLLQIVTDDHRRKVVPLREHPHIALGYATTLKEAARSPVERVFLHLSAKTPDRLVRAVDHLPRSQAPSHAPTKSKSQGHTYGR